MAGVHESCRGEGGVLGRGSLGPGGGVSGVGCWDGVWVPGYDEMTELASDIDEEV